MNTFLKIGTNQLEYNCSQYCMPSSVSDGDVARTSGAKRTMISYWKELWGEFNIYVNRPGPKERIFIT